MVRPIGLASKTFRQWLVGVMLILLAGVALGVMASVVFRSKQTSDDNRIWVSDAHRDAHGITRSPNADGPRKGHY